MFEYFSVRYIYIEAKPKPFLIIHFYNVIFSIKIKKIHCDFIT